MSNLTRQQQDAVSGASAPAAKIDEAAKWLAVTPRSQRGPAVPEVQRRFGLTAAEACEAVRQAGLIRARAT